MEEVLKSVDIQKVNAIAVDAGKAIMDIYNNENLDWNVEKKADNSPLTIADHASNKVICDALQAAFPDIPILSEENKTQSYEERKDWDWFWLVDPLDGTKEFIKKNGEFTVNIALVHGNRSVLGVLYVPATDELFYAKRGEGAFKVKGDENVKLVTSKYEKGQKGVKIVCSRSHMSKETEMFVAQFNEPELLSKGSSLKFMLVAEGLAHVYPRIAPTMEWDTGASQIIVEEAGGRVVQYQTDEPLLYNKEDLLNPFFEVYP
ncbi:MAG: 3'(2'),5'-bisphosphate nucleotidase CysQ [Bacteroidia bacterium]